MDQGNDAYSTYSRSSLATVGPANSCFTYVEIIIYTLTLRYIFLIGLGIETYVEISAYIKSS